MTNEELETRLGLGQKFVTANLADKLQMALLIDHGKFIIEMQAAEIKFTRKMAFFAWFGWVITVFIEGFLL